MALQIFYDIYEWYLTRQLNPENMPKHIAIIMDGNRRYSKLQENMDVNRGHELGVDTLEKVLDWSIDLGIQVVTAYAFSTENFNRPKEEVDGLMKLLRNYMKTCLKTATKNRMSVRVIGDKSRLDEDIQKRIVELENLTRDYEGIHLQIAINYGGRDEIRRCIRTLADKVNTGELLSEEITEDVISNHLDTSGIPDPDLLIRTCNELRISNFLLWQLAYSELYFTEVAWPDFDKSELMKAIESFNGRSRKYGGVEEQ